MPLPAPATASGGAPPLAAAAPATGSEPARGRVSASRLAVSPTTLLAGLLLLLLAVLQATGLARKSMTYDEPVHLRYGWRILHGNAERFDDSKMPVSALNALTNRLAEELPPSALARALARPEAGRHVTIAFSLLLAALVWAWARRLYGPAGGILSLTLHVFDPNLLAHGRLITTDLYAALAVAATLYCFWRFLSAESRRSRAAAGIATALVLGLAQLAKYTSAFLFPLLALLAVVRFGPDLWRQLRRRRWSALARRLGAAAGWSALFLVASLAVINAGFLGHRSFTPFADFRLRSEPFQRLQQRLAVSPWLRVPVPYPYLEGMDWVLERERTGRGYGNVYLLGETRSGRGFPGYFLVASLFKVPLPTQLLLLMALIVYLRRARRVGAATGRRRLDFPRNELALLLPVALFVVYFNLFFRAQMGIRHFLVVFPLLYVFAGSLLAQGWRRTPRAARAGLALLLVWLAASVLSYAPHFLSYFNELTPDRKMAYRILADSNLDWGQNAWYLERYREAHPEAIVEPREPTAGRIVVGANYLVGVFKRKKDRWIHRRFTPDDHVAYSYLVFDISPEEAAAARAGLAGEAPSR